MTSLPTATEQPSQPETTLQPETTTTTQKPSPATSGPSKKIIVTSIPADHSVRGVAIGFSIVVVLAIAVGGLIVYRRMQRNRRRADEFLLTDSVFRYDGYAQVDEPT